MEDNNERGKFQCLLAVTTALLIALGAVFSLSSSVWAQQTQCGFTSYNDYVCPGVDNGFSGNIQPPPTFKPPKSTGSGLPTYTGGSVSSGTDYQAALRELEAQLAEDQQALEDFMADPEAYDDGSGHVEVGDISPIELSAAQCLHDSTETLPNGKLPVIPGAAGFGMDTPAGRGGEIIKVTNLNDSGSGSLRACVEASGPRTCVFEVSGEIKLSSNLEVKNPYLTIAGQTAPNPGITLRGAGISIAGTHDILIQHLRIRIGDEPDGPDPLERDGLAISAWSGDVYNVVYDHLSVSWSVDKASTTWFDGVHDITYRNTIFSEALNDSINPQGKHSFASLIGDHSKNVSYIGNLWAHNYTRNPAFKGDTTSAVLNNVMYNAGNWSFMYTNQGSADGPIKTSVVGNVLKEGPDSTSSTKGFLVETASSSSEMHLSDNTYIGEGKMYKNQEDFDPLVSSPPVWPPGYQPLAASDTQEYVLSNAGSRPADRDSVDNRVINDVINGTGRIIDSQSEVGGWPSLAENYRVFNAPDNPNGDDDGDGYTNLEEVLHAYAAEVEGCI